MLIEKYFKDDDYLKSVLPDYRYRETQVEASKMVMNSFNNYKNAIIEAPTGSGKTIAYLIPAILSNKKVIIATKTKQLMNQLYFKDLPVVQSVTDSNASVHILKGRKNYFCPQRFYKFIIPNAMYYQDAIEWYDNNYQAGIVEIPYSKFEASVCDLMSADRYQCNSSKCGYYADCPFYIEKQLANEADVVITNHHLLLSDIALKAKGSQGGVFDFRDYAIFDEAHSIGDIYSQYAGVELHLYSIISFFRENRSRFVMSELEKLNNMYFKLHLQLDDHSKILYSNKKSEIQDIVEYAKELVTDTEDDDLLDEYIKYYEPIHSLNSEDEGIRYIEKQNNRVDIKFIPYETGESFIEGLGRTVLSSVFISATLNTGGDFSYFMNEIGIEADNCDMAALPPVFNFQKQAKLYVPTSSDENNKDDIYIEMISNMNGSCLIICNSIDRMMKVKEALVARNLNKRIFTQNDVNIGKLDMGDDLVLIGCATLREGIDLSGGSFKCVILDKLPFENFTDFVFQKRADKIKENGGNSFLDFSLPRAVLYFKQAIGRLIRHEEDTGLWAVFDSRIISQRYGKKFIDVLKNVDIIRNRQEVIKMIGGGFDE